MWTHDPSSFIIVKFAWSKLFIGTPAFCLSQKIEESKSSLKKWNRDVFGNIHFKIKTLTDQINTIQDLPPSVSNFFSENSLLCELNECMIHEDMHWRQKSRNQWLTSTNLNTRFFHLSTIFTGSCGPTSILWVYGINKKSSFLCLKNRFSSRFPVFTIQPPGLVQF